VVIRKDEQLQQQSSVVIRKDEQLQQQSSQWSYAYTMGNKVTAY